MNATRIHYFIILITGIAGLVAILMRFKILSDNYLGIAFVVSILGLVSETTWQIIGRPAMNAGVARDVITPVLNSYCEIFSRQGSLSNSEDITIRSNVMIPRSYVKTSSGLITKRLRIKYHSNNMSGDRDLTIELERWQGVAGNVWAANKPLGADLTLHIGEGMPFWLLSPELVDMTRDIKIIVSTPIRHPKSNKVVGVLSFDSRNENAKYLLDEEYTKTIKGISEVIADVLQSIGRI